ncbi:DUF3857 domain-containing protein [Candidatus Poribacteria bacterium]|nr:DUF3857 domain-containing protein [Candidatus Poribacteria bacterium]
MNKYYIYALLLSILFQTGCAPKSIILKKDLGFINTPGVKEYPNAGAIILLDSGEDIIYPDGEVISKIHQIIKILNDRGKYFGELSISYNSSFQTALFTKARTIKPDGTIIIPSDEAHNEITPYAGYNLYSDIKQKTVSMPAIEPGAIIDYEVVTKSKFATNKVGYSVDWFFQINEPILLSKYSITLPKKIFSKINYYNMKLEPEITEYKDFITYKWEKRDIPEIVTEPLMPSYRDIVPWFRITTAKNWEELAEWYIPFIKDSFRADTAIKIKVKELIKDKTSQIEKIKAIFYFIEKNIRYVGLEWGINAIKPHNAGEIFKNAYGDCKDQSTLLITMLREAGISAYPVLILSDNVNKIDLDTPTITQFNHMIAYVISENTELWLDPTTEVASINELPTENQEQTAWIIKDTENKSEFKNTIKKNALLNNHTRIIKAVLLQDGSLECDVVSRYKGDDNLSMRETIKYTEPQKYQRLFENLVNTWCPSSVITSYSFSDFNDMDSQMELRYSFKTSNFANVTSKFMIFNPNILYRLISTSFASQNDRKYSIQIAKTGSSDEIIEIKIPDRYIVEEIPLSIEINEDFASFSVKCRFENNTVYLSRHSETKSVLFDKESYNKFKNYYETIARKDNEKIVLEKINKF